MKNIQKSVIFFESGYADRGAGVSATDADDKNAFFPDWSNFTFKNITCVGAKTAVEVTGIKGKPVRDMKFEDITILQVKSGLKLKYAENFTFTGCTIRSRSGYEFDITKCKNILYNGKDPLSEE